MDFSQIFGGAQGGQNQAPAPAPVFQPVMQPAAPAPAPQWGQQTTVNPGFPAPTVAPAPAPAPQWGNPPAPAPAFGLPPFGQQTPGPAPQWGPQAPTGFQPVNPTAPPQWTQQFAPQWGQQTPAAPQWGQQAPQPSPAPQWGQQPTAPAPAPQLGVWGPQATPAPQWGQQVNPVTGDTVAIPRQEYTALAQAQAAWQAQQQANAQHQLQQQIQHAQQQIRNVASHDGIDRAIQIQNERWQAIVNQGQQQLQQLESSWLQEKKMNAIQTALTGIQFVSPEAAADAYEKVSKQFDIHKDPLGTVVIRQQGTLLPVKDAMANILASPLIKHCIAPTTQGGVGLGQASAFAPASTTPGVPSGFTVAQNPGQQAYAEWLANSQIAAQTGSGGMGLSFNQQFNPFQAMAGAGQGPQTSPFAAQPQVQAPQMSATAFNPATYMQSVGGPGGFRPPGM